MDNNTAKKGRSHLRIIESDSESDFEDGDQSNFEDSDRREDGSIFDHEKIKKLSISMKRVQLADEEDDESFSDSYESHHGEIADGNNRKPPPGRNPRRLEGFSWSSSDEESEESDSLTWSSLSEKVGEKNKPTRKGPVTSSQKTCSPHSPSLFANASTISPRDHHKASEPNKSHWTKSSITTSPKLCRMKEAYTVDLSFSDSASSSVSTSSNSDDDYYRFESRKRNKNSKNKNFSWSFNKSQKDYTIGGTGKLSPFSISSDLYDKLYDFQKDGVAWMTGLYSSKIGGILADDMGMGKTFTTLSLLGGLLKAKTIKKVVVVAPVSVLRNWENEARKILPLCCEARIQVLSSDITVYNRKKRLHQVLEAQSPQLVITSFGLVANNPDHFSQNVAGRQVWDYVVLDEAHKIKNPNTKNSKAMEIIAKSEKTHRLILTGTPIMNNLKELHALFNFATSGKILGTHKEFQNKFGKPIEAARSVDADNFEVKRGEEAMQELQQLIQPYFLQRMKAECLAEALPPKHEYVLWTNLSPLQREMYTEYIRSETVSSILEGEAKSPLFAIAWLQKLCGHPLLVGEETVDSIDSFDEYDSKVLMAASAKLEVMYNLVDALIRKGHRTLIFSQSTKVLDIIERVLKDKFKLLRIDGQTKEKDRQRYVDEFNEQGSDVDLMLISTKAGGQGLTLTGADSCVVYDPSWNPAEDAQAVDRCYRIGQKKEVQVFRLVTAGTVEEKRYEKQIHKDGIRRAILTNTGNNTAKYFTKEELRKKVFVLGDEGECEFLDKLEMRGFAYDTRKNPDHSYCSQKGVVGQSSHDIVYSLPENFYFDELIKSPSHQPFSSLPTAAKWFTKKDQPKVMGRSQKVFSKKNDYFEDKENKEKNGNITAGKIKYLSEKPDDRSPTISNTPSYNSLISLKKNILRIEGLHRSGNSEQAVGLLMELLDNKVWKLSKANSLKVHELMASITDELGWLDEFSGYQQPRR